MGIVQVLVLAAAAHAQDPSGWTVVVASTGDDGDAAARAATRASEHLEAQGQRVISGPELDQRIGSTLSRPFVPLTTSEQSQLNTIADAVAQQVMYGDDEGTQRAVAAAVADAEDRLAALGRDDASARRLGDLVLYSVRARVHARQADAARRQVVEALRLCPDYSPAPASHPGDVRRLLDEARAGLSQTGVRLDINVEGGGDGCRIRAQGRIVQRSAFLPPGAYQLQVECGEEPGRVHAVNLAPGNAVSIDASLDAALGNRDGLVLRYASEDTLRNRLPRHVQKIGAALRVANVLVVRSGAGDTLTLERFQVDAGGARRVASARVALSANERLPPAIDALVAGRSVEIEDGGPVTAARDDAATAGSQDVDSAEGGSIVPPLLLGIGGAALIGVAVHGIAAGEDCVAEDAASPSRCAEWERPNWAGIGLWGGLGVAVVGAAIIWIAIGSSDHAPEEQAAVGIGPGQLTVRGAF